MKVIILAGGQGNRIKSVFPEVPKCLIPVHGQSFIEFQIEQLTKLGFVDIVLSLGYKSQMVIDVITRAGPKSNIQFCVEREQLGTLGAIKYAFNEYDLNEALVLNGDTFFTTTADELCFDHSSGSVQIFGILTDDQSRYGGITVQNNEIVSFNEKGLTGPGIINSGLYGISKSALDLIPDEKGSWEETAIQCLLDKQRLKYRQLKANYLHDIGTPDGYKKFMDAGII